MRIRRGGRGEPQGVGGGLEGSGGEASRPGGVFGGSPAQRIWTAPPPARRVPSGVSAVVPIYYLITPPVPWGQNGFLIVLFGAAEKR